MAGQVRVDPPTPGSDTNIFYPLTLSGPISPFELQKKQLPLYQLGLEHPAFVIHVINDQNFTVGPLWELANLDRILIFFFYWTASNDCRKAKTEVQLKLKNKKIYMQSTLILPLEWSGENLVSGGVCSVFAWGAERSCQAQLDEEQQRQKWENLKNKQLSQFHFFYPVL